MMQEDKLQPNIQTYAAIFECLGRLKNVNRTKKLKFYYKMMSEQGITMDDIVNNASFIGDQQEVVVSVFKRIVPDYVPKYKHPDIQYTCSLLEKLNVPEQLVPFDENDCDINKTDGFFTKEQLKKLTYEQMQIEMDGYVKVEIGTKNQN